MRNGEDPQKSLESLFGGKDNLNSNIYRETQAMKAEHPPKEYAADYIDGVSNKHNNMEPAPTAAQYNTHIMDDKSPKPENYSTVSDENRNGVNNVNESSNAAVQNRENDLQAGNAMRTHADADKALTDSGKYKYSVETVPSSSIDTSTAMGMDNPNFGIIMPTIKSHICSWRKNCHRCKVSLTAAKHMMKSAVIPNCMIALTHIMHPIK